MKIVSIVFFIMHVFILQDRTNSFESMKFSAFESQLLDIMRSTGDTSDMVKGKIISQFINYNKCMYAYKMYQSPCQTFMSSIIFHLLVACPK